MARPYGSRLTAHGSFSRLTAVSAMDVLFHIVDDEQYRRAFVNIASALAPGGWFIWSDNFLHHDTERVTHQASRSLAESEDAVRAAGFEIVERVPMFVLMNYPTDSTSKLGRLAWTAMVSPAALAEPLGWLVGAALAPRGYLADLGDAGEPDHRDHGLQEAGRIGRMGRMVGQSVSRSDTHPVVPPVLTSAKPPK